MSRLCGASDEEKKKEPGGAGILEKGYVSRCKGIHSEQWILDHKEVGSATPFTSTQA